MNKFQISEIIGFLIIIAIIYCLNRYEVIGVIFKFIILFLFWILCIYSTITYNSDSQYSNWKRLILKAINIIIWTVIIFAAFFGLGLQEVPWEIV